MVVVMAARPSSDNIPSLTFQIRLVCRGSQPIVAAHFLQIIDICKDVWTLSILGICPPTSCHKQQMAVFNYFSCFVACRNITKVESDPLKWESHKISRQKKNGTSLMSSAKIPENDYPLALRHLLKRRKIPAFSLQPISPFLGLCDHLTSAVTSVGEVPVSDVNKVWNALKCYNLHPDPCWLATRECRKGRWSEVSFGGQTLQMPHHVGWTIYMHYRILFCPELSTASLLARPWPLPLADTFSFLEFLGPPSWRGAAVAPYISPSIN